MKSPQDMRILQIDITNACVYQCSNCTRFCGHHKKPFFMDFDTFCRAVDSLQGYHGTIGVMGGEPTLHPEFERFVSYLHAHLPQGFQKDHLSLVHPQRDFVEAMLLENKANAEIYAYHTGRRETIPGAGLWTTMGPLYKRYYEQIQDTFKMQAVNDHGNTMYHSPILINRRDLGIPDETWHTIRDHCWAQEMWSATITPKGAFFCEIAGALDMLFDGPGGWPIEPDWWRRQPEDFGDQLRWCEYCGIAIETFTRDANDRIDDVSETMYRKLQAIGSPKLAQPGRINRVEIRDGKILPESLHGALEVRKELFYDGFLSRFNRKRTILYPDHFSCIMEMGKDDAVMDAAVRAAAGLFDALFLLCPDEQRCKSLADAYPDVKNLYVVPGDSTWGHGFAKALRSCRDGDPIVYLSAPCVISPCFRADFGDTVLNPGTLHVAPLDDGPYIEGTERPSGRIALFHKHAQSLRRYGADRIANAKRFADIEAAWLPGKRIGLSPDIIEDASSQRIQPGKRYVIYGAGLTGRTAQKHVAKANATLTFFVDSDPRKWGQTIEAAPIRAPEELQRQRDAYDTIIIASGFAKEIEETLVGMGFSQDDYIEYE